MNSEYSAGASVNLRIKELCKMQGIAQKDLAEKLGIGAVSFSQAVNRNNFDMKYLKKIADALEVSIPELFEDGKKLGSAATASCPHCGKPIKVNVSVEAE